MVIYNLDETPDVFITPNYYDDVFSYRMEQINGEDNRKTIRTIDLRSDKLMIYGTQVQESMFKRLYESLILRPKVGILYVNCNGACYVLVAGKTYRPIHNVIFDWSSFGVVVPNSVNDSLRKQVEEKDKALQNSVNNSLRKQLECELAKNEVESTKASLKASNDEIFELKKVQNDLGLKLQKAYEKVALIDFELELYKIELESCKKESNDFLDELCNCKDEGKKMKVELQKMHDQLSSEISSLSKRNCDLEMKSEILECELSSLRSTLHSTKEQLVVSNKNSKEHLSSFKDKCRVMEEELNKVQEQLVVANKQVQHTTTLLESSTKEVKELQDQIKCNEKEQQCMKAQLQKMINQIKLINMEVMASNQKLDQVLISSLWKELNNHSHHKVSIQCTKCGHIAFVSYNELGMLPSSLDIDVVHDISIL